MYEEKILELIKKDDPDDPLLYVRSIVTNFAYAKMSYTIRHCNKCKDCSTIRSIPYGIPLEASILIVNDYVSKGSPLHDHPLQSEDAKNLFRFFEQEGIEKNQLFVTNAVNCFSEKLLPNKEKLANCKEYLTRIIDIVQPQCIVFLGNIALNSLLEESFYKVRGQWLSYKEIPCMVTYNPREIRLSQREKEIVDQMAEDLLSDLKKVIHKIRKEEYHGK